jgi:hypothetical protein
VSDPETTVLRQVKETIYQHARDNWTACALQFANEAFSIPAGLSWGKLTVVGRPSNNGTMGAPGHRRIDRRGAVFMLLREPPNGGDGNMSDLADKARKLFEGRRFDLHDVRFNLGDIGDEGDVDGGTWWGVTVEVPFDYEDWN